MIDGLLFIILDKIVLAILVGLVTSWIFFLILLHFKPKIEISPKIACGKSTKTGQKIYRIKVINRSRAALTDIQAQLHICKNYQTATGEVWKSEAIKLTRPDPISIDKYNRADSDANYAYRFLVHDDIEERWKGDSSQFLRFRIFGRHSFSGFGGFFLKDYRLKRNSIVEGNFSKGDTFEIV